MIFLRMKLLPLILSATMGITITSVNLKKVMVEKVTPIHTEFARPNYILYPRDVIEMQIRALPKSNSDGCYDTAMWNLACLRQSCPDIAAGLIFGGKVIKCWAGVPLPYPIEVNHLWVIIYTKEGDILEVGGNYLEYDYITYIRF